MDRRRSALALIAFPLAYALAVFAGRATRLGGGEVALVWPAAAVAVIWLLATRRCGQPERLVHLLLLGVTTFVMNLATGAAPMLSAWFVLVNAILAVVTVSLLTSRRVDVALRDPADLAQLIGAVAGGSCAAAAVATVYLGPVTQAALGETFALFAVRNGTSALLGVALYLRLQDLAWTRPRLRLRLRTVAETLLIGTGIVAVFLWNFWLHTGIPMAFLALVPATWVALRYSTTVSTVFLVFAGVWITLATLSDRGSLIVPDVQTRALLSQAMVSSLTIVVLALALFRDSRARLISELRIARDLFAGVLNAASEQAIIGTDPTGHITVFNHGAERLLGWTEDEMLGRRLTTLHLDSEIRSRAEELGIPEGFEVLVHKVAPGRAEVREWTFVRRDGTHAAVSLAVSQMPGEDGRCTGYIGVATDITEQKAAEVALMESEERFRLAFDTAPMGMFMFEVGPGGSGRITRCNQAMANILGRSTVDVLRLTVHDLDGSENHREEIGLGEIANLGVGDTFDEEAAFRLAVVGCGVRLGRRSAGLPAIRHLPGGGHHHPQECRS